MWKGFHTILDYIKRRRCKNERSFKGQFRHTGSHDHCVCSSFKLRRQAHGSPRHAPSTGYTSSGARCTEAPTAQPKVKITLWEDTLDLPTRPQETTCYQDNLVTPFNAQSKTTEVEVTYRPNPWKLNSPLYKAGQGPISSPHLDLH